MCSCFENPGLKQKGKPETGLLSDLFSDDRSQSVYPDQACFGLKQKSEITEFTFGLKVDWTERSVFNARIETIAQKPTFAPLLKKRCLIPCLAYYEWRTDERGHKHKNRISSQSIPLLWMAAVYDQTHCIILTRQASDDVKHIHGRMPLFIHEENVQKWWDASVQLDDFKLENVPKLKAQETPKIRPQMELF